MNEGDIHITTGSPPRYQLGQMAAGNTRLINKSGAGRSVGARGESDQEHRMESKQLG